MNKPTDRRWWSRPANRVTALSLGLGAVILVAQAGYLSMVGAPDLRHDLFHALAVMAIFFVSEGFAIHLRVRRGGHAMSVSEIPVVLGILTARPGGAAGGPGGRRRAGPGRAAPPARAEARRSTSSLLGLQATVTALIFAALAGRPADVGPREWLATLRRGVRLRRARGGADHRGRSPCTTTRASCAGCTRAFHGAAAGRDHRDASR